MTDGQMLLLVLWLLYLTDCFLWLERSAVAFIAYWGNKWRVAVPSMVLGNAAGGMLFLNPFPPLGRFVLYQPLPVSVSPECIAPWNPEAAGDRADTIADALDLSEISQVALQDGDLWLNGQVFCRKAKFTDLKPVADLVETLTKETPQQRAESIERFWRARLDAASARHDLDSLHAQTRSLRRLCIVQFLYLYAVLPLATWCYGLTPLLIPSAALMLLLAACIAAEFFGIHRRLFPTQGWERGGAVAKFLLCPPVSIRALDLVMEGWQLRHHGLALAELLLEGEVKKHYLGAMLRDMQHPTGLEDLPEPVAETCLWQNKIIERIAADLLPTVAGCIQALDEPPTPQAGDCHSYCPRCLTQFSFTDADCPDCAGVRVRAFSRISEEAASVRCSDEA